MNFSQRKKIIWLAAVLTILFIGIVAMLNYVSLRHFFRLDLTDRREFAIDASSKSVLRQLPDIVTAKVFFSDELPPNLVAVRQHVADVLDEFASYSRGNLAVRFFNPSDEAVAEEANALGIPAIRMNILSRDKFEVKNGFLGLAFMYGGKHEILPVIQDTQNLEYDMIAAIAKLTNPNLKRVGFTTGHHEYPIVAKRGASRGNGYVTANAALQKYYDVISVSLQTPGILETVNTLVVGGPDTAFTPQEKLALDQYLMKGGNLIFLLDGALTDGFESAQPLDVGLFDLLAHYGVSVRADLVLDPVNETATFEQEEGLSLTLPYPFWVKAVSDNFSADHAIVRSLDNLVFPWASSLSLHERPDVRATSLVSSSGGAWTQTGPFDLRPETLVPPLSTASSLLAAFLEGEFTSFYAQGKSARGLIGSSDGRGRILVVGNSRFLTDQIVRQYPQNLDFFLNAVDFMTLDETLTAIRSKSASDRPLIKLSDSERRVIKLGGTFLMPALVLLFGVLRHLERRKKKIKL